MLAILTTHPIQYQVPLWRALAEEGSIPFEVWLLTDHGARETRDREFGRAFAWDIGPLEGYPHRFLTVNAEPSVNRFFHLRLRESLAARLRESGAKALWIQGWQVLAYWQAVAAARRAGVPVWLRAESNDLAAPPRLAKRLVKRPLLKWFLGSVDEFLCIGQANQRLYESYGAQPEQLHRAPYCVDNDRFARQAEELRPRRAELRREWGIPEDAFCVLFCGKFIAKKRPEDLIQAAGHPRLKEALSGRPIHLLFAGSGEMEPRLRSLCRVVHDGEAEDLGFSPSSQDAPLATFAGFLNQTEISRAYVAADCLVLPSDQRETWGLVVNEAMASGLPCAASDACGCSEDLIAPVDPTLRFPLGNADALADALARLIQHPLSPSAWRKKIAEYRLEATVETVKQIYQKLSAKS